VYFSEISIDNFGPIKCMHFQLQPRGVNMIVGRNSVGKTQLLAAIYTVLFDNNILQYHEDSAEISRVTLQVNLPYGTVNLTKEFTNHSAKIYVSDFDNLLMASKINKKDVYFFSPEEYGRTHQAYSKEMIRTGYKFLCGLGLQSHHILGTCLAKKETNVLMSVGEQRYIELIYFLSQLPENSVFLGDSLFSVFDEVTANMVLSVFEKMNNRQFILAENTYKADELAAHSVLRVNLTTTSELKSPVSYNYMRIPQRLSEPKSEEADIIVPINYCINQTFPFEECKEIEFKEIRGSNPCDTIVANAEIYINAFLNSALKDTGKIFWGVDDNKTVKGVNLSYKDKRYYSKKDS
jgi:ABC-type uncharacterized transport system ATPase subunit